MNPILRLTLAIGAGLLTGWVAARFIARLHVDGEARPSLPLDPEAASHDVRQPAGNPDIDSAELDRLLSGVVATGSADDCIHFSLAIVRAGEEDFPRLAERMAQIPDATVRMRMVETLFAAWAKHDPLAALRAGSASSNFPGAALNGVLNTWAEQDPVAMLAWLRSPEAPTAGWAHMQAQRNAFVALAARDPAGTMVEAQHHDRHHGGSRLPSIRSVGVGSSKAVAVVFREWARMDAAAAQSWLEATAPDDREHLLPAALSELARTDPASAWSRGLSLTSGNGTGKVIQNVLPGWLRRDPPAAIDALASMPAARWTEDTSKQTGMLVGAAAADRAATVAAAITDDKSREHFWSNVAAEANQHSPAMAAAALDHLPADSEDRISLSDSIVKSWARIDPVAASEWVRSLPHGTARDFAAASLAESIVRTEPAAAASWAASIQSENTRAKVLGEILSAWRATDLNAAAAWEAAQQGP